MDFFMLSIITTFNIDFGGIPNGGPVQVLENHCLYYIQTKMKELGVIPVH